MRKSHVTHMNDSCTRIHVRVIMHALPFRLSWHDAFICVTWLIHMCDMTHLFIWHDSFLCVTWLIHVWHDTFACATRLICMRDMTHLHMRHDSFAYVTWLTEDAYGPRCVRGVTHLNHITCSNLTLIRIRDMTPSYMRHDSLVYATWLPRRNTSSSYHV